MELANLVCNNRSLSLLVFRSERKSACLKFIPKFVGSSHLGWRQKKKYYIFLLVLVWALWTWEGCLQGILERGSRGWLSMLCVILKAKAVHQSVNCEVLFFCIFLTFLWREHVKMAKQVSSLDGIAVRGKKHNENDPS